MNPGMSRIWVALVVVMAVLHPVAAWGVLAGSARVAQAGPAVIYAAPAGAAVAQGPAGARLRLTEIKLVVAADGALPVGEAVEAGLGVWRAEGREDATPRRMEPPREARPVRGPPISC